MSLKNHNLNFCELKSLVTSGGTDWTPTSGGSNEYYYNQLTELTVEPLVVLENSAEMNKGVVGSLTGGDWDWDLTEKRLVVRLSDDTDPDTKADNYVKCSEPFEVFQATTAKETIILSLLISNTEDDTANTVLFWTDSSDELKAAFLIEITKGDSYDKWADKIVMEAGDKLKFMASREKVNVLVSIDES